jgi:hypothetical protein
MFMKAIRIDEPCHEKWNEMTPTDRGAFCQKCAIDVYDFSKMDLNQVKLVLKESAGQHMCGKFESKQLDSLNHEFEMWKLNQPKSFQSRFVFALLLVFGLTLFSCEEEDLAQIAKLNSIELKSSLAEPDKTLANKIFWSQDSIIVNEMMQLENIEPVECIKMGELAYPEDNQPEMVPQQWLGAVAGGPMIDRSYYEYLDQTIQPDSATALPQPLISVYNPFETKLFPNPTNGPSNFSIFVNEPAQFQIEVYSISGQKINELHKGELSEGRHQFDIDLSNYNTGTYLIKVWSEKQEETIKLIKVE